MKVHLFLILLFSSLISRAQFLEFKDPKAVNPQAWDIVKKPANFSFIDTEFSLSKSTPPSSSQQILTWNAKAWKNETIHTQLAFWGTTDFQTIQLSASPLTSDQATISADHIQIHPITYVLSDLPGDLKNGCGINVKLDSILVADRIDNSQSFVYQRKETRPIWLSIAIPKNTSAGLYNGKVYVNTGSKEIALDYTVQVASHTLPDADEWSYHLDLWQNPYSVARHHEVEPFSTAHFEKLTPHIKLLADAGQKSITATLIYDPWNGQTYDKYDAMIKWVKAKDGSWRFDYSVFDTWVAFMQNQGIDKFINCYSMIPWNLSFYYFDELSDKMEVLKAKPGEEAYEKHWLPFLIDFAAHLKQKGWFEKTTIAMDERPMKDMLAAINIIKKADPDFKISLAGTYHEELAFELIDYCITLGENMPTEILEKRKSLGYNTTAYTCCSEIFPNTFTNSGYSESVWLAWNSVERGFDGYLRWAYDCWNATPDQDTRYGSWLSGDTYLIYPDNTTSIRFERLREGIQDAEKIKIIREYLHKAKREDDLEKLNKLISTFNNKDIKQELIPKQVKDGKSFLNSL
ncbi:DUF4091 domain-containing protein [Sphingobacterium alkalisoli]|uniref:DUF4091 domain-containing protein n=1 Tax=Sphingobacterium alkalisoli TaxID=1874115 RepID=A0A4U0H8Z1_9SPHI|nr:DUF4091 domain-containing protein [Sphingobacterium alkalisoli]TJY68238.1 DUF4091 domain-containing protein [Sphingobacterium alkalisoli]GGH07992.1 hypothetical protein GCM10011418_05310 [Sphingobacterium alkalisoli]